MNITTNYKTKIIFILVSGFFIVSIITAISSYSVYQYKYIQLLTHSNKVVKLFNDTFKYILQDAEYFKSIDFSQNEKNVIDDFKHISRIMYSHNKNINAISLIKQFDSVDYDKIRENISLDFTKDIFNIKSIQDIIKNSEKSNSSFSSIIMHSNPIEKTRKSVGIELSSEENRFQAITKMHRTNMYTISRPVQLVHRYKDKISNSIMFYPLHKNTNDDFYTWFVGTPFTYEKILDNIVSKNPQFNDFYIEVFDRNENVIAGTRGNNKGKMILILEEDVYIGDKTYAVRISTNSLLTFTIFWQNILGFFSGMFFLCFIGYYLFYKEQKNIEVSALKFRLAEAQKISSSGHCIWKKENNTFVCSEGLVTILDLEDFVVNGDDLFNMIYKEDKENIEKHIKNLQKQTVLENGNITFRMVISNSLKWLKMEYRVFYKNDEIDEVFVVIQDITSFKILEITLKENNEEFRKIAITDHLTGTYNRVYFDKEVITAISNYKRYNSMFTLLLLDIDHFKKINDNYGHNEGDKVLVQFATLIKSQLRDTDIFCRWGGEEFAILIPHIDKSNAVKVANKLKISIEKYKFSNDYSITCSIGLTQVEKNDKKISLLERVDKALYSAKENGRNQVKIG